MATLNVLQQSFVNNLPVSNQRLLNAQELDLLSSGTATAFTFSGSTIKLQIDMAGQRTIDGLYYAFSPASTSGVIVEYGRDLNNLTAGTVALTSSGVEIFPTLSGFNYPRYFIVTHTAISGNPEIAVSGLFIKNSEDEIQYGQNGLLDTVTITSSGNSGYSPVTEIKVMNSGIIPTDIYVSLETYGVSQDILENFEISPTSTGVFSSFDPDFVVPTGIPWEWGNFNNTAIIDEELRLEDPAFNFPIYEIGNDYNVNIVPPNTYGNSPYRAKKADGSHAFVIGNVNNAPLLIDPIRSTVFIGASPTTLPANDSQRSKQHFAWDGQDRIYYMLSRTSNDQNIYYYKISTNTQHILTTASGWYVRYHRPIAYNDGNLYVYGGKSTAPTSDTDGGNQFWKINVSTLVQTQLSTPPISFDINDVFLESINGYIYIFRTLSSEYFGRYIISLDAWEAVQLPPTVSVTELNISANLTNNEVWVATVSGSIERHYINHVNTAITDQSPVLSFSGSGNSHRFCIGVEDSLLYRHDYNANINFATYEATVLKEVPPPVFNYTVSGSYVSPIFKLENITDFHRLLIEYTKTVSSDIKFDNSIGVDNFQIRGSDESPSAYNTVQNFDEELDTEEFVIESKGGDTAIGVLDSSLVFSHLYISPSETPFMSGYITYGFPLITTGDMQYKFWWNPPSNKVASNVNISKFYICPFINTLVTGQVPERNTDTLVRTQDDHISLQLGQPSDSNGNYSQLSFYKGDATVNYTITASTGNYYLVELMINWDTGVYKIYFNGAVLGTGNIPLSRINLLKPNGHTYEIHSLGQNVSFDERFKYVSISRVGVEIEDTEDILAVPVHRNDPLFGDNGSLQWFPVTVNSALLPKQKFVQAKLTLRGSNTANYPTVKSIKFPKVIKLENVAPGETKSVFIRYKFPAANNLSTNLVYLKSWMYTDKL